MDSNALRAPGNAFASLVFHEPDPPIALVADEPKKETYLSIEAQPPRFSGATSFTRHADGSVLLSRYSDGASVMLHFSAEEWAQIVAGSQEGT